MTLTLEHKVCTFGKEGEGQHCIFYGAELAGTGIFDGHIICRGCCPKLKRRELQILNNLDERTAAQQVRLDLLDSQRPNEQRNRLIESRGRKTVLQAERGRQRGNSNVLQILAKRPKGREYQRDRGAKGGKDMVDRNKSGKLDYSEHKRLPEILKVILLVIFQLYPLELRKGGTGIIPEKTIKEFLLAVLDVVGRACGIQGPFQEGRLRYRAPGFNAALNEVLESAGPKIWRVKREYGGFVEQGHRDQWNGMR